MYIKRHMEKVIDRALKQYKVVLLTGPRQIGKTSLLKHNYLNDFDYLTFDDINYLRNATEDPILFMKQHKNKTIFDEVQYVPSLFSSIKLEVDKEEIYGRYLMTGSQAFHLMKNVSESLAGRIAIRELQGLSLREKYNIDFTEPFLVTETYLNTRKKYLVKYDNIWNHIHRGSFPRLMDKNVNWDEYLSDYVKTYINRDVREIINVGDELTFSKFMIAIAARSGELLNYTKIANEVEVSVNTVKRWISALVTSGIVYLLEPYSTNILTRNVKTPKLYFLDTGLLSYLTKWTTPQTLQHGAVAGHVFETFVVSEIIKTYKNAGYTNLPFYFYRDKEKNEIDLIIEKDNTLYPVEIKMSANPTKHMAKAFSKLEQFKDKKVGLGVIICQYENMIYLKDNLISIPLEYI
ncbi:MAG: ATP-binding protein [Acholeplasmataceae bacterium]